MRFAYPQAAAPKRNRPKQFHQFAGSVEALAEGLVVKNDLRVDHALCTIAVYRTVCLLTEAERLAGRTGCPDVPQESRSSENRICQTSALDKFRAAMLGVLVVCFQLTDFDFQRSLSKDAFNRTNEVAACVCSMACQEHRSTRFLIRSKMIMFCSPYHVAE